MVLVVVVGSDLFGEVHDDPRTDSRDGISVFFGEKSDPTCPWSDVEAPTPPGAAYRTPGGSVLASPQLEANLAGIWVFDFDCAKRVARVRTRVRL